MKEFRVALFDLDGTLIDTEGQYTKIWGDIARKYRPDVANLEYLIKGTTLVQIFDKYFPEEEVRAGVKSMLDAGEEGMRYEFFPGALEFIADTIKSHVRAMEGALAKVNVFLESFKSTTLNNDILSHLLRDFIEKEQSLRKLSIEEIQTAVAKKYNVSMAQILSPERTQSIVTPRQLSMYIARKFTTKSLPEIAKLFDKTHATIIHGVRNIEKRLDVETDLKTTLEEILSEFGYNISDRMD